MTSAPVSRRRRVPIEKTMRVWLYILLTVAALLVALPFLWVISGSLRTLEDFQRDPGAWFPSEVTFDNFTQLFAAEGFGRYVVNSVVTALMVVVANVVAASMAGYALAKLYFVGKRVVFGAAMVAFMLPYTAVFVPQFVVTVNLGLADTLLGIALPWAVSPLNVFIMRQFAAGVPEELLEAARMDGASEWRIFRSVFLPLAGPALAVVTILSFVGAWNSFLWPLVVAQSADTYTLPVGLATLSQAAANVTNYGVVLAGALLVMAPVIVVFVVLQRYFVQGIATTGLR